MIEALIARVALWCAAIVGILLMAVIVMAVLNRSLMGIAMRNVIVSPKKSGLVVFGLVLSTILTTASLGLGDSMGASMQSQTAAQTGLRDVRLTKIAGQDSQIWQYFAPGEAQQLMSQVQANPEVAAVAAAVNTQGDVEPGTVNTQGFVPVYDKNSNGVSSENQLLAVPSNFDSVWGPLYSDSGQSLRFADLQPGDVYVGGTLAHLIGAKAGHHLTLLLNHGPVEVTVRAVLNTEVDPSEKYTLVMPLAYFQQLAKVPGAVNVIYVKNKDQNQPAKSQQLLQQLRKQFGNIQATQQLKDFLNQLPRFKSRVSSDFNSNVPPIDPSRAPLIAFMDSIGKPQVSDALVNSVQDRAVQSMLKRVVTKIDKNKLPQLYHLEEQVSQYRLEDFKQDALFLSQLAGAGTSLGLLGVSSLLIAAAMLLIYLIFIMLMAERKMELGISRALGLQRRHLIQMQIFEGMIYILISSLLGLPLGIGVTSLLVLLVDHLPVPPWGGGNTIVIGMHVSVPSLIIAFTIGFLVTFIVVTISAYRISRLNIVAAIRDQEESIPPRLTLRQLAARTNVSIARRYRAISEGKTPVALPGLLLTVVVAALRFVWALLQRGLLLLPFGLLIILVGSKNRDLFVYTVGVSLCIISIGSLARWLLPRTGMRPYVADKVGFAILGCGLVLYWALPVGTIEKLIGLYSFIDMEHFRHGYLLKGSVSSVTMISVVLVVIGSIWFVLYNGDWLLKGLLFLVRPFGRLAAALRLSVLYALKNRLRTGLNIAMFALVSFVVVLFLTMGTEISHNSGVKHQSGNWQILTDSTGLPHNFDQQVMADPHLSQMIERAGAADNELLTFHITNPRGTINTTGFMRALNDEFLDDPQLHIFPRGEGYTSDSQVWNAVKTQPDVAVMYFDSSIEWGVQPNDATFKPFDVQVVNSDGAIHTVKVIGFIPSGNAWPLAFVSARTGQEVYGAPVESNWFVFRVKPGVDANQVQATLTATFGQKYGMQPELNSAGATKFSSFLTSVFNMLAGYLALGLVIGLCGLAVISRRVVLERVQQIGIMRAIGCGSEQIPRIFLLESSFIAFLGLFIGAALALWWAYQFTMIAFPPIDANDYVFQVPAIQIGVIIVAFYLIILVATYLPARTASRIAPAAALRYE